MPTGNVVNGSLLQSGVTAADRAKVDSAIAGFLAKNRTLNSRSDASARLYSRIFGSVFHNINRNLEANSKNLGSEIFPRNGEFQNDAAGVPYTTDGTILVVISTQYAKYAKFKVGNLDGGLRPYIYDTATAVSDAQLNRIVIDPAFFELLTTGRVGYKDTSGQLQVMSVDAVIQHEIAHMGEQHEPKKKQSAQPAPEGDGGVENLFSETVERIIENSEGKGSRVPHDNLLYKDDNGQWVDGGSSEAGVLVGKIYQSKGITPPSQNGSDGGDNGLLGTRGSADASTALNLVQALRDMANGIIVADGAQLGLAD